ncbi:hypothetical protein DOY81_005522 [Sarcophaga bullata]|nr:hypothetical protein DOY81_005522 [Sarcophaga bullata]
MSSKQMKTYDENRGSDFIMENEPEEGEIVDDYDLIVSSDEELSMRRRIRELEAENEEIEQIAVISRSYADRIHPISNHIEKSYAAQMPTDVSSISSTDFVTPKKRKRKKSRERKRKHCNYQHQHSLHHQHQQHVRHTEQLPHLPLKPCSKKAHCKRRQKLYSMSHQKSHSNRYSNKEISGNSVSLESLDSSDSSSSLADSDSYRRNYLPLSRKDDTHDSVAYITRDTLRLAVARNSFDSRLKPKKSCLKDKLLKQEHVTTEIINCKVQNIRRNDFENDEGDNDDDDDVQVIETEPDIQTVDEDSSDSMEEKELRLIALKSAVLKKHMARKMRNAEAAYSPTDFDEMLSSGILQQDQNIDDLDVIELEDDEDSQNACIIVSPEASPQLKMLDEQEESQQMVDCKPIDMDIANSDSEDTTIGSWPKEAEKTLPSYSIMPQDFSNQFQYGFYMHELPIRPPPPPGVDDYEDTLPPPTYHKFYNSEMRDMELDDEECSEVNRLSEASSNYYQQTTEAKEMPFDRVCKKEAEAEDEEEEEALRALLLSKFQSPKNQIKCRKVLRPEDQRSLSTDVEMLERSNESNKILKPTEFILKEAVKRLKVHSQSDNLKETESVIDSNGKNQNSSYQRESCKENNFKSSILLATLRDRLLKCKDQNQTYDHGEKGKDVAESLKKHDRENYTYKFNSGGECGKESKPETTNIVDISDISRRLQKIKEDVLNKQLPKVPLTNLNETLTEKNKTQEFVATFTSHTHFSEVNNLQYENKINLYNPFHNNIDIMHASNTIEVENAATAGNKTIEANFDVNTNQTTLRVTIKNIDNVNADDKLNVSNSIIPYKEVKVPEVVKNTNKADMKNIIGIINDGTAETCNKSTKIKTVTKTLPTVVNKHSIAKPEIKVPQVPAATTYSAVRARKIVKPNKVINTNIDLKRRDFSKTSDPISAPKAKRQDQIGLSTNPSDGTRLITSIDQVKHMCKVASFIISVQNSSNESSEDEWDDCDSLYKSLSDYNDNASPLSLNLESPSLTPLRSNSPTDLSFPTQNNTDLKKKIELKFETETNCLKKSKVITTIPKSDDLTTAGKTSRTPLAVRHLPVAAQSEYRRLVHRMMLLENKRKSAITGDNKNNNIGEKSDDADAATKSSLVKKVLIRNASNNTSPTGLLETKGSPGSTKLCNTNILRSYENLAGIVSNLDKSLKLVEEAKRAKTSKIKLENRIKKLKAEMEDLQAQHKDEQQKISHIYPSICTTNEVITSLKQKRTKIFKAAINLGKTLKGEDYRLNNDLKETINLKIKQLASEIKMVNSLKIQDVWNSVNSTKPHKIKELTGTTEILEDCKAKLISENSEKTCFPDTIIDDSILNSKGDKENEEKCEASTCRTHTTQAPVNSQFGGNTEFQNVESNSTITNKNQSENGLSRESLNSCKVIGDSDYGQTTSLTSYISPLEHLRNINSDMDPNGVVCPYDLMGNCEDSTCKYVHISTKAKS